jgi:hypothetical protein
VKTDRSDSSIVCGKNAMFPTRTNLISRAFLKMIVSVLEAGRLSVEGESTSGSCNTSRKNHIGLSVVQVRMASPGCLTDGCPNVHPTNLDC